MTTTNLTVSDILKKGWQLYYKNWRLFVLPLSILLAPYLIIFSLQYLHGNFVSVIVLLLLTLVIFLDFWLTVYFTQLINNIYLQKPQDINTLYETAFRKIPGYLVIAILSNLLIIFGLILLIVPGIIFMVWYHFTIYIKILEEKEQKIVTIFKESKDLVRGRWWDTFFRLLTPSLIVFALGVLFIMIVVNIFKNVLSVSEIKVLANYLITVMSIIFSPLFTAFMIILFNDLKNTKTN